MPIRPALISAAISLAAVLSMPSLLSAQGNVGCVSPTDRRAINYRDGYGSMVSRTDAESAAQRTRLGLPTIPNAQVIVVTDTTKCRIASAAYDTAFHFPTPTDPPLVLQVGTQYVVIKGLAHQGRRANVLFNQTFTTEQKKIMY